MAWLGSMLLALLAASPDGQPLFFDDFESGLARWEVVRAPHIRVEDSGDPSHGGVLVLETAGDQYALIQGSEHWGGIRMEGDVMFPTDEHNYLGVVYDFRRRGERTDFGLVYIKGNGSYLQANPHRDFNVSRLIYPEYHVDLRGQSAIQTGKWQRFKVEVVGRMCHFYVGDMATPQMTFPHFELDSGAVGLQPRCCGGPVWIDNVRVTRIARLSYEGPPIPDVRYAPQSLLTSWQVHVPPEGTNDEVARRPDAFRWERFVTDVRGAVVTGKAVDYLGPRSAAYFRTRFDSGTARNATLHISTADDIAVWINGRFRSFAARGDAAWFDFGTNPDHAGRKILLPLRSGDNDLVIRVRGGVSATGGFFARIEP